MSRFSSLPAELSFLKDVVGDRFAEYRSASWLVGHFDADIWRSRFGWEIDFRVKLDDGILLTDKRHNKLLEIFKIWLCVQSHFDSTGGTLLDDASLQQRIRYTVRLIDYFLLNAEQFQLATYGLENVTENDIRGLILQLAKSSSIYNSVYHWPERLETFLCKNLETLTEDTLNGILASHPMLQEYIPALEERMLRLSDRDIVRARAWLWTAGYYSSRNGSKEYRYMPRTTMLAALLFPNTLAGKHKKAIPLELCVEPIRRYIHEYPAVPVKSAVDGRMSEKALVNYIAVLRRLGLLEQIMLPVPTSALRGVLGTSALDSLDLKPLKRYRNLPQELIFCSLRNSIEFALRYGDDLIASYLNIAREATRAGIDCRSFCMHRDVRTLLTPLLVEFGVKRWTIQDDQCDSKSKPKLDAPHPLFQRMRANEGLWELLRVLYGVVQVCVGILMARRQGELTDLISGICLDNSKTRLVFFNEKSGLGGMNRKEARPIPRVAVRLIELIERLQDGLISIGNLETHTFLFAYPALSGVGLIAALRANQYNETLDYFCDYFETSVNSKGERYYIRQHQLRRFIAMLFFWGRSFGGLDTLRWFLGHTDVQHLYHYITESTPGDVLRSIKATYAADQLRIQAENTEMLAALLEEHFGTRSFAVLDSEELTEYIEQLVEEGRVEIEPEFLRSSDGSDYRILIVVTQKGRLH